MRNVLRAATTMLVASAIAVTAATPARAATPPPQVFGYATPTYNLSFWVPQVPADDSCHTATLSRGDTSCFGDVGLGAHLTGLPKRVYGTGRFDLHWSESFVCTDTTTLVKDPLPERRTTLHGYASTEDSHVSGRRVFVSDARGWARLPAQKFIAHSPNANGPDQVDLPCGPNERVERSAVVLDELTLHLSLLGRRGRVIRTYPDISVPGTYVAPWWAFAGGNLS